jgi:hypothetical protein
MTAVLGVTPILNVSDIRVSIEWFEQMGWRELWVWRDDDAGPTDEPWGPGVPPAPPGRPHLPGQLRPELTSHGTS